MDNVVHSTIRKYKSGFSGCISNVTFATDYHLDIMGHAAEGRNIHQCKKNLDKNTGRKHNTAT